MALAEAARDVSGPVRHAAVSGLRELTEVLEPDEALTGALRAGLGSPDPAVRAGLLDVLAQLRAGDPAPFASALSDPDHRVRLHAARGLATAASGNDEAGALASVASDPAREVRVAVAEALAALGTPQRASDAGGNTGDARADAPADVLSDVLAGALARLAGDRDPLVRAAALKAFAAYGCPPPFDALAVRALREAAEWEVRAGAARALSAAVPEVAVVPLAGAASDSHADVRKAAVIALSEFRGDRVADAALAAAGSDTDADVRAYAAR